MERKFRERKVPVAERKLLTDRLESAANSLNWVANSKLERRARRFRRRRRRWRRRRRQRRRRRALFPAGCTLLCLFALRAAEAEASLHGSRPSIGRPRLSHAERRPRSERVRPATSGAGSNNSGGNSGNNNNNNHPPLIVARNSRGQRTNSSCQRFKAAQAASIAPTQ